MSTRVINRGLDLWQLLNGVRKEHRLMLSMMLIWGVVTGFFSSPEFSSGINQSVPIMIVLSVISFLILLHLCWWLLLRTWARLGLPAVEEMVLDFKSIDLWKQLGFFWLSFALLLASAVGCLAAVL